MVVARARYVSSPTCPNSMFLNGLPVIGERVEMPAISNSPENIEMQPIAIMIFIE